MAYTNITKCTSILANALTSSKPHDTTGKVPLISIGNTLSSDITEDIMNQYIRWACDEIDSSISEMYRTPLHRISNGEWYLNQDIDPYNPDMIIIDNDDTDLTPGDTILIISTAFNPPVREQHIVKTVDGDEITVEEPIFTNFPAGEETRVVFIDYNPPVVICASRLACGNLYDKYFAAQASPNMSDYGKTLRELALNTLSDILNGTVILHGQERLGYRFLNANLYDRFSVPNRDGNTSREKMK